jgi:hypothetical protein
MDLGVFEQLSNYGILGLSTLALGAALWFLLKRQLTSEDNLKNKVDTLQKEINEYIREDHNKVISVVENNTKALQELRDLIIMNSKS